MTEQDKARQDLLHSIEHSTKGILTAVKLLSGVSVVSKPTVESVYGKSREELPCPKGKVFGELAPPKAGQYYLGLDKRIAYATIDLRSDRLYLILHNATRIVFEETGEYRHANEGEGCLGEDGRFFVFTTYRLGCKSNYRYHIYRRVEEGKS